MIYFTSDLHFCHDKEFIWKDRGFSSVWEMNRIIIENWNSIVNQDDDVYILGDLMLNNDGYGLKCLKSLKGKIHIIRGNHDTDSRLEKYRECYNVVEVVDAKFFKYKNQSFFLSHFPSISNTWNASKPFNHRYINLCGHVHTKDKFCDMDKGCIYHVEVDAHNCAPVPIDKILTDIQEYREKYLL